MEIYYRKNGRKIEAPASYVRDLGKVIRSASSLPEYKDLDEACSVTVAANLDDGSQLVFEPVCTVREEKAIARLIRAMHPDDRREDRILTEAYNA